MTLNAGELTTVDLSSFGPIYYLGFETYKNVSTVTRPTGLGVCDGNRAQEVISSLTYTGAKGKGSPDSKMYVKGMGGGRSMAEINIARLH